MIGHFTATNGADIIVQNVWSAMVIQVDGANLVTVQAKTQFATSYESSGIIKLLDYSIVDTLTEDGLYMIDLTGLDSVKISFSGGNVYYNVT